MKNRKFIVVAFMLTACMIVGVGYAALTDTLNIGGDAEVSQAGAENTFDGDVYFTSVTEGHGYHAHIDAENNDKIDFTVTGLGGIGDSVTITATIYNDSDLDAVVKMDPVNTTVTNSTYFDMEYSIDESGADISSKGSLEVTITIKMIATPHLEENQTVSCVFSYELDVASVDD